MYPDRPIQSHLRSKNLDIRDKMGRGVRARMTKGVLLRAAPSIPQGQGHSLGLKKSLVCSSFTAMRPCTSLIQSIKTVLRGVFEADLVSLVPDPFELAGFACAEYLAHHREPQLYKC